MSAASRACRRLILKLWRWAAPPDDAAREEPDEADYETRRMLDEVTALHKRRYYFALIKIIPSQVTDRRADKRATTKFENRNSYPDVSIALVLHNIGVNFALRSIKLM